MRLLSAISTGQLGTRKFNIRALPGIRQNLLGDEAVHRVKNVEVIALLNKIALYLRAFRGLPNLDERRSISIRTFENEDR